MIYWSSESRILLIKKQYGKKVYFLNFAIIYMEHVLFWFKSQIINNMLDHILACS